MHIESQRLTLSEFTKKDAPFFYDLINDPDWIRYIGDRNVRTHFQASVYLEEKILPSYQKYGFGFYIVRLKTDNTPIGLCGLINREWMDYVDIGYAFLPDFRGQGYALEAAKVTMKYAKETHQIKKLAAITALDNTKSSLLLEKLGFYFDKVIRYPNDDTDCKLYLEK